MGSSLGAAIGIPFNDDIRLLLGERLLGGGGGGAAKKKTLHEWARCWVDDSIQSRNINTHQYRMSIDERKGERVAGVGKWDLCIEFSTASVIEMVISIILFILLWIT